MPDQQKQPSHTVITIPQFMTDKADNSATEADSIRKSAGKLYKLMLGISIVWLLIVIIYITQFFGWSNLFLMMPDEFGGFLAGITLPLAVIWMVIAYIDRGASFKQEAKLLHTYMNQLVYPEDGAAQTTKAMADAIREQVIELQQATKQATVETEKIKNELGQHVADFSKLIDILQGYSGTTMNELNEGVRLMSQGLDYINNKINTATTDIESKMETFSAQADTIQNDMSHMTSALGKQLGEMQETSSQLSQLYGTNSQIITMNSQLVDSCSTKLNDNFSNINQFVAEQNERLEQVVAQISKSFETMYSQLENKSANVEHSFAEQTQQIVDYLSNLDKTSLLAANKFDVFRGNLKEEVDRIIGRAQTISESVELQVQNLTGVSDAIQRHINEAKNDIDDKIKSLQQTSHQAVTEMTVFSDNIANKINNLNQIHLSAVDNSKALCTELDEQNNRLMTSLSETQANSQKLCEQIVSQISTAKASGDDLVTSLQNTESMIVRQTASLQNVSENLDTQSRLNTASVEQQYKLLSTALNKIENTKDILKQQMDDLLRMANMVDDEANGTIRNMGTVFAEHLEKSKEIVAHTNDATTRFKEQTQAFEQISDKAVAKVMDFTAQIKDNQTSIDELTQNIVSRAENVANLLETQIKAVNNATANTTTKHTKLLELFNQQSSILNNTAENAARYVADVTQALDEKAEILGALFKNQQEEFFTICDRLSDNASTVNNTLKNQISQLEQGSDRVFGRMAGFEEEFSKKANLLTTTSNQTIDKLVGITDILSRQNQEIDKSVASISTKMKSVSDEVNKYLSTFNENLQTVKNESSIAGNEIMETCNKLKDSQRSLLVDSHNVSQMIENQIKVLDGSWAKITAQSDQIATQLNKQKDSIADVVNIVSTQTRLGEASLAQQYKYLSDAANDINNKMKEIEQTFKSNASGIFDSSSKLAFEINSLSDKIIKAGEDVQKTTKQSVSHLEAVGLSLSNTADALKETVGTTQKQVDNVIGKYQSHIAQFNTVTAEASSGVVEVNNLISQQNDKMIKISEDTKNLVEGFNVVLNEASSQLTKRANTAYEQIKEMGTKMKELSLQLEDSTQLTAKHMTDAGDKMRANIGEIAANAERISNDVRASGEVFVKQSEVLVKTSENTISQVSQAMELLKAGSENLTVKGKLWQKQSDEFTKTFERQAEIIDTTALKAGENLRQLEAKYQEVQTDSFLKDAATLFEKMETVAIDINRIFNPTTEEEIWKKYYQGDTAAFVRYLAKVMTKSQIGAIRKEYEENADFRSLVNRYVADFEMLVSKAKGNERAGVLLSVISGSDVGKVYYIIAKALDKLN